MAKFVLPTVTAGIAVAGAGFWLAATSDAVAPHAARAVQLASVDAPLSPATGTAGGDGTHG